MSARRAAPPKKDSYHHGDLRKTLMEASLRLIESDGVDALSLREVARTSGVTHGAPYHHFKDKRALLDAISEEGFAQLRDAMIAARALRTRPDERLEVIGRAYVRFAVENAGYFQIMFRPAVTGAIERGPAAEQAFQVLVDTVTEAQRAGLAPQGPPEALVLFAWSAVHGLASLWLDGALGRYHADAETAASGMAGQLAGLLANLFATGGAAGHKLPRSPIYRRRKS
jgi:AcrR family transcriptional regulator